MSDWRAKNDKLEELPRKVLVSDLMKSKLVEKFGGPTKSLKLHVHLAWMESILNTNGA